MNQYQQLRALGNEIYRAADLPDPTGARSFRVVDVGAGNGATEYSPFFAELSTAYVGVDLDDDIFDNTWVDEQVHLSAEAFAERHVAAVSDGRAQPFDLATAIYVWEHHPKPAELLRAMYDVLAPGGQALLITPNGLHPFGLASKVLARTGLTDTVLRKLRPEEIDDYHFHVVATRNTPWSVKKCAAEAGFADVEVLLHDEPGVFKPYLPKQLAALPNAYSKAIKATNLEILSGTLIIRVTKAS